MKKQLFKMFFVLSIALTQAQNFTSNSINYTITDAVNFYVTVGDNQGVSGSITIPSIVSNNGQDYTVNHVKDYAFSGSNIISITLPNTIATIKNDAFANCTSLTTVVINGNLLTTIEKGTFYTCTSLTSITIPNSITTIGDVAFFACTSIPTFVFGDHITSIGDQAFGYCNSLSSFTIDSNTPPAINAAVFNGLTLANIHLNSNHITSYQSASVWMDFNTTTLSNQLVDTINFSIAPNPTNKEFSITLADSSQLNKVSIYNSLGQNIASYHTSTIDIEHLNPGIYFVELIINKQRFLKKLIKD